METFHRANRRMLELSSKEIRRRLIDRILPTDRLVAIKGIRGVGKTTFLLRYANEQCGGDASSCLYVNLNHFYFAHNSLYNFAEEFYRNGGRLLLLDQVFKYPNWATDMLRCMEDFPNLRIIFTSSSVMTPDQDHPELSRIIKVLTLHGFSFREYINYHTGLDLEPYPLEYLLRWHEKIASQILNKVQPLELFGSYLMQGYYPPEMDQALFGETLVKNLNMLLEVDMVYIRQIEPSYLHKLRKLMYLIGTQERPNTNITRLSDEIGTSRATVMNYLKYLSDAGMIRMVYKEEGSDHQRKPDQIFLNDPNIASVMYPHHLDQEMIRRVFLLSQLANADYSIRVSPISSADFLVDGMYHLRPTDLVRRRTRSEVIYAVDNILIGTEGQVPLWLFGFLY